MYDYRRGESILGAFLLGGLVGAALGLLFSPRSGRENREFISSKAQEYWGEGKEFYETSRAKVMDETEELRVKIDAARDRLKEQVGTATQTAKEKVAQMAGREHEMVDKTEAKAQEALDKLQEKTAEPAPMGGMEPTV
jgi:gas vesicle protein